MSACENEKIINNTLTMENLDVFDSSSSDDGPINLNDNDSSGTDGNYHLSSDEDESTQHEDNETNSIGSGNYCNASSDDEQDSHPTDDNQTLATDNNYHVSSDDDDETCSSGSSSVNELEMDNIIETFNISKKVKYNLLRSYHLFVDENINYRSYINYTDNEKNNNLMNEFIVNQFDLLFNNIQKLNNDEIELLVNNDYFKYFNEVVDWEYLKQNSNYENYKLLDFVINNIKNKYSCL